MFIDYISQFEVKDGKYNFQSKEYKRKYLIEDIEFFEKYDGFKERKYLMEHPILPYSYLRLDIDIKPSDDISTDRLYNMHHIFFLIKSVNELISNIKVDVSNEELTSCLFEKEAYTKKDGFHLSYPNLMVINSYQDSYIVKNLKKVTATTLPSSFTIDSVATKPWVLIGSCKDSTSLEYKLTKVFNRCIQEIENPFSIKDFSINKQHNGIILGEFQEEPIIIIKKRPTEKIQDDYNLISNYKLLDLLSSDRYEEYDKWILTGILLFNIGEGDDRFFNLWVNFSMKSQSFDYKACKSKWKSFVVKGITIRTLIWWVRTDNPDRLEEIVQEDINDLMYEILFHQDEDELTDQSEIILKELLKRKVKHLDVAKIFRKMFSTVYTYYCERTESKGNWFKFYNGKWNIISRETILKEIEKLKFPIITACTGFARDKAYIPNANKHFTKFNTTVSESFADQPFIDRCLKACQTELYDDEYGKKIDKNKYLLGCNNGVLDFEKEIFRDSSPDDYISLSTGITYKDYAEESSEFKVLHNYFEEVFPDIEMRELALDILSSCLIGMNTHKIFVIAIGNHDAGKSATMSLLEKTFGEYSDKLDKSIILQKSSSIRSSDARPDLIITKGKRIIITQETGNEQVNVATVKELTGNDTIYARALHKGSSGPITPMFTLFLACNELPRITQNDEATWRRIVILEFQSKFVDNAPKTREEQLATKMFPIDRNIQERLTKLAPYLLSFLFKRCIKKSFHKNASLNFTDSILAYKEERRNKNDPICLFFKDCITKGEEDVDFITVTETFTKFKDWFPSIFPSQKMTFTRESFKENLSRYIGKVTKKKPKTDIWANVKFSEDPV